MQTAYKNFWHAPAWGGRSRVGVGWGGQKAKQKNDENQSTFHSIYPLYKTYKKLTNPIEIIYSPSYPF